MKEYIQISKELVMGAIIGINAFIKPGGVHRLSPLRYVDEVVCGLLSSIDHLIEAVKLGDMVRRGEISATAIDYGKLLSSSVRDVYRECGSSHPQYIVPLTVISLAIGLSEVESILQESSKFKRALETINNVSKWSDLKQFIDVLKVIGREDMYDHLQSVGYTQIALLRSGVTFNDLFRVLSSKWKGFTLIDSKETLMFSYLKRALDLLREYRSHEQAILAFYIEIIKSSIPQQLYDKVKSIEQCRFAQVPECLKHMYELDTALRKAGYNFEWASEISTLVSSLLMYES